MIIDIRHERGHAGEEEQCNHHEESRESSAEPADERQEPGK